MQTPISCIHSTPVLTRSLSLSTLGRRKRISVSLNPKDLQFSCLGFWILLFLHSIVNVYTLSINSFPPPTPLEEGGPSNPSLCDICDHPSILSRAIPHPTLSKHDHKTQLDKVAKGAWPYVPYNGASANKGLPVNSPQAHLPQRRQKFPREVCVLCRFASGRTCTYIYLYHSHLLETETLISYCFRHFNPLHWAATLHKGLAPGTTGNPRK